MLKVNCECHVCLMVGRCPCISSEVQLPLVILSQVSKLFFSVIHYLILPVASSQYVCAPGQKHTSHHGAQSAWKVCDSQVFLSSSTTEIHNCSQFERVSCSQWPITQFQHYQVILVHVLWGGGRKCTKIWLMYAGNSCKSPWTVLLAWMLL